MDRRDFIRSLAATAGAAAASGCVARRARPAAAGLDVRQAEIDEVTPADYAAFRRASDEEALGWKDRFPALDRYDEAFDRVFDEALGTQVKGPGPAVWYVYNMGIVVKTREALFTVDLQHRQSLRFVPHVDFAMVTHNHDDHYDDSYLQALDRAHKTVITNFDDNYGARATKSGGYTRRPKSFRIKDVGIRTFVTSHNDYLLDFTMPFEIAVGGYSIFHSGDSAYVKELERTNVRPDLWLVHPYNGLDAVEGARVLRPKRTCVVHLQEFGHAKDRWRWRYADGQKAVGRLREAGFEADMPLWGERLL